MKKSEQHFYSGVLAALAIVALHDQHTIFCEIVEMCDEDDLIAFAVADDQMETSGLAQYGYKVRPIAPKAAPRTPRKPRRMEPAEFSRKVREITRLSVTGKPVDVRAMLRLREYDSDQFDAIAEQVRKEEQKKVNPFNSL